MALQNLAGVALITGAGSGIGRDSSLAFAAAGVVGIIAADINLAAAQATSEACQSLAINPAFRAIAVRCDVRDEGEVQEMVARCVKEWGRVDYGVNCAGLGRTSLNPIASASMDEYDLLHAVNVKGTILVIRALASQMATQEPHSITGRNGPRGVGRGSIVCLASGNGYVAEASKGAYVASKHAVMGVMKTAAIENAPLGIRINAVCPAWTSTPMMDRDLAMQPETKSMIEKYTPIGRMALPEEVGDVVVFLSSEAASYVSGTGLMVDGGVTLSVHV